MGDVGAEVELEGRWTLGLSLFRARRLRIDAFVVQSGADRIAWQPSDAAVDGGGGVRNGSGDFSNTFLLWLDEVEGRSTVRL